MDSLPYYLLKAIRHPEKVGLAIWAYLQLWSVDRNLQTLGCQALQDTVPATVPPLSEASLRAIRLRAGYIEWIARLHPCKPLCLHRSLVLYRWLRQQGIPASLEVGWGDRIGHAWVSYGGLVLNDRPDVADITPPFTRMS
jgi:hypothetical protein